MAPIHSYVHLLGDLHFRENGSTLEKSLGDGYCVQDQFRGCLTARNILNGQAPYYPFGIQQYFPDPADIKKPLEEIPKTVEKHLGETHYLVIQVSPYDSIPDCKDPNLLRDALIPTAKKDI